MIDARAIGIPAWLLLYFVPMIPDDATIHLAHDWLVGMRGGERVLDRLCRLFGPTVLYTMVADGQSLTPAIDACTIRPSRLQKFPAASGRLRRHYLPLYAWAVDGMRVEDCDLLISTSSAAIKSLRPPDGVPHLCYCHSPARYVWEQTSDYAVGSGGGLRRMGLSAVCTRFKRWDRARAQQVTQFVANSQHTAGRIRRCFDRDAVVVYPPVRTSFFTHDPAVEREPWYLVVSALEPYKRTDLVIDAANAAGVRLKVAGTGSQLSTLRDRAGSTVEMLGRVDDATLHRLFQRARALVFPQQEDFGIVPVEAQSAGCPIIAYGHGGALETVTEDTGIFFEAQTVDALTEALRAFEAIEIDSAACVTNADRFSEANFDEAMRAIVTRCLATVQR